MGALIGVLIGLAVIAVVLIFVYRILIWIGFNSSFWVDNVTAILGTGNPIAAWALLGAFLGACAGIWLAAGRYRFGRVKPLVLLAVFMVFVGLGLVAHPERLAGDHPYKAAAREAQTRVAKARHLWEAEHARYVIAAGGANVRNAPSTSAGRLATLPRGRVVYEVQRQGSWILVEFANDNSARMSGWIRDDLVSATAPRSGR